jgi:hypothetical protein
MIQLFSLIRDSQIDVAAAQSSYQKSAVSLAVFGLLTIGGLCAFAYLHVHGGENALLSQGALYGGISMSLCAIASIAFMVKSHLNQKSALKHLTTENFKTFFEESSNEEKKQTLIKAMTKEQSREFLKSVQNSNVRPSNLLETLKSNPQLLADNLLGINSEFALKIVVEMDQSQKMSFLTMCHNNLLKVNPALDEKGLDNYMKYGRIALVFGIPHPEISLMALQPYSKKMSVSNEMRIYQEDLIPLYKTLKGISEQPNDYFEIIKVEFKKFEAHLFSFLPEIKAE